MVEPLLWILGLGIIACRVAGAVPQPHVDIALKIQNVSYDRLVGELQRRNRFLGHMEAGLVAAANGTVPQRYVFVSLGAGQGFVWVNFDIVPPSTVPVHDVLAALDAPGKRDDLAAHALSAPGLEDAANGTPSVVRVTWPRIVTEVPLSPTQPAVAVDESARLTEITGLQECNQTGFIFPEIDAPRELAAWMAYIGYVLAWVLLCGGCYLTCGYTQKFEPKRTRRRLSQELGQGYSGDAWEERPTTAASIQVSSPDGGVRPSTGSHRGDFLKSTSGLSPKDLRPNTADFTRSPSIRSNKDVTLKPHDLRHSTSGCTPKEGLRTSHSNFVTKEPSNKQDETGEDPPAGRRTSFTLMNGLSVYKVANTGKDAPEMDPNLEAAEANLKVTSVTHNGAWRSVFFTRISEMSEIGGNGTELYFRLLQILGCTFALLSGITFPSALLGLQGNFAPDIGGEMARTTIGNLGFLEDGPHQEQRFVSVPFLGCNLLPVKVITVYIAWFDWFGTLFFLAVIGYFRFVLVPHTVTNSERESLTCRDYTLEVDQLPRSLEDKDQSHYEEELREHFMTQFRDIWTSRKGRLDFEERVDPDVSEIVLVRDRKGRLQSKKKLAELKASCDVAAYHKDHKRQKRLNEEITELTEQLEASKLEDDSVLPVVRAYVTINTPVNARDLAHHYRFSTSTLFRRCQRRSRRFHGMGIRVQKAPEPSNILWPNQDLGYLPRLLRKVASLLVFLVLIFASMVLIYLTLVLFGSHSGSTKNYLGNGMCDPADPDTAQGGPEAYKCMVSEAESWTADQVKAFPLEKVGCWCLTQGYGQILLNSTTRSVCTVWLADVAKRVLITAFASIIVVIINIVLQVVLVALAEAERSPSISGKDASIMVKIATAQTLNTGVVPLIVNMRLPGWMTDILLVIPGLQFVGKGDYSDFVRGWYTVVGLALLVNMLANAFLPALRNLARMAFWTLRRRLCSRFRLRKYAQTQLLQLYTNPDFDISTRYAQVIMTVFVTMMYSSGLPLLNLFAAIFMFCMFWVDKYVLLRASKRPPFYDSQMPTQASQFMIYAVPLHCIFALLMFGQPCTFPSNALGSELVGSITPTLNTDHSFLSRLTKQSTWMIFGLLLVFAMIWLVWTILWAFAMDALWRFFKRAICGLGRLNESYEHKPWPEAKAEINEKYPPASYRYEDSQGFKSLAHHLSNTTSGSFYVSKGSFYASSPTGGSFLGSPPKSREGKMRDSHHSNNRTSQSEGARDPRVEEDLKLLETNSGQTPDPETGILPPKDVPAPPLPNTLGVEEPPVLKVPSIAR